MHNILTICGQYTYPKVPEALLNTSCAGDDDDDDGGDGDDGDDAPTMYKILLLLCDTYSI